MRHGNKLIPSVGTVSSPATVTDKEILLYVERELDSLPHLCRTVIACGLFHLMDSFDEAGILRVARGHVAISRLEPASRKEQIWNSVAKLQSHAVPCHTRSELRLRHANDQEFNSHMMSSARVSPWIHNRRHLLLRAAAKSSKIFQLFGNLVNVVVVNLLCFLLLVVVFCFTEVVVLFFLLSLLLSRGVCRSFLVEWRRWWCRPLVSVVLVLPAEIGTAALSLMRLTQAKHLASS